MYEVFWEWPPQALNRRQKNVVLAEGSGILVKFFCVRASEARETKNQSLSLAMNAKAIIFIIDDDEHVLRLLERYLLRFDYEILLFTNAQDALGKVRAICPDLVLTDLIMPVMNGVEFEQRFHALQPDTEVVCISAFLTPSTLERLKKKNFFALLPKPFDFELVATTVAQAIASTRLKRIAEEKSTIPDNNAVLVVDDYEPFRTLAARLLTTAGFWVETAANGQEALEKFSSKDFEIVLMDLTMPVMDGLQTLREMRKIDKNSVVALITGEADSATIARCEELTGYKCLRKPLSNDALVRAVKQFDCEAIKKRRMEHEDRVIARQKAGASRSAWFGEGVHLWRQAHQRLFRSALVTGVALLLGGIFLYLFLFPPPRTDDQLANSPPSLSEAIQQGLDYLKRDEQREMRR